MTEHRIISLIASATEIVAALGFESQLVGRSHECDYPSTVSRLPQCSESKVDVNGSSRAIDDQVKSVLREAISVYRVHPEKLDDLQPSVIITQTQCEVCAVSLKDVEAAVCEMVSSEPEIVSCEPMCLADVWTDIRRVAEALDANEKAESLIAELQSRLKQIAEQTRALSYASKPRVACIEWIAPVMTAGNWVPELVEIAGGEDLLGVAGEHSGYFEFRKLIDLDPDLIIIMPCGFGIARAQAEMPALVAQPGWSSLRAVRGGRVYLTDGNQYFNRPGPRMVESAEILAEVFFPGEVDFGHEGIGWVRFEE